MIRAIDLFCGAGGTSTGLANACEAAGLGLDLLAINHWDVAIATHSANHPGLRHLCESLDNVDPRQVVTGRVDLLMASPECFPAGTLVLTERGLVPIERVWGGDRVLTHQGRWRRVRRTMASRGSTVVVQGQGHYGLEATAAHPFYARTQGRQWINEIRRYRPVYSPPEWRAAGELDGHFWATPTRADPLPVPPVGGRGMQQTPGFWWMVGRWLADGTVRTERGEITIAVGTEKADDTGLHLAWAAPDHNAKCASDELRWRRREIRTAVLFETAHKGLASWLVLHFGKLAHGKTLPAWALAMPSAHRQALLDGYLSGDGAFDGRRVDATTVSRRLAVGLRLLAESLGHRVCLTRDAAREGARIEGRPISTRDQYRLYWTADRKREFCTTDDLHSWSRTKGVQPGREDVHLYNLEVEEDESYIADGIVVHNCTHHSIARGGRPVCDQSRASAWHVVRWAEALRPRWILVENVREFRSWGPVGDNGRPLKRHRGETYAAFITALRSLGYTVEDRLLNAADYGEATTRERLFVMARRGRRRIPWPEPTHRPEESKDLFGSSKPWRAAREVIDWTIPGKSIFTRKRPLAPATLRRIEAGLRKFGGVHAEPFLVVLRNNQDAMSLDRPLPTVTTSGAHFGLAQPFLVRYHGSHEAKEDGDRRVHSVDDPLPTQDTQNRYGLARPFVVPFFGERDGQAPRCHSVDDPLPTVTGQGAGGLVQPFLLPHRLSGPGHVDDIDDPLRSFTATNGGGALVEPFVVQYHGNGGAKSIGEPLGTITTKDRFGLVQPHQVDILFRMLQPHELAAAMGFDSSYEFTGTKADRVRQIGNAVCVNMARALCGAMLEAA